MFLLAKKTGLPVDNGTGPVTVVAS